MSTMMMMMLGLKIILMYIVHVIHHCHHDDYDHYGFLHLPHDGGKVENRVIGMMLMDMRMAEMAITMIRMSRMRMMMTWVSLKSRGIAEPAT